MKKEIRLVKDGDSWMFVLPEFENLQKSKSFWCSAEETKDFDTIYEDLTRVDDHENVPKIVGGVPVTKRSLMKVAESLIDTVIKKNHDYGNSWQSYGIFIPAIRMKDKLVRCETLADGRKAMVIDESFEDTVRDIVAYGWLSMLRMAWEKEQQLPLFNPETVLKAIEPNETE